MTPFSAVVLAAGKGKRTHLPYPKVLHPLCGKPMIRWVTEALLGLSADEIVVVVSPEYLRHFQDILGNSVTLALQQTPLGTGDALRCGLEKLKRKTGTLLVAYGDTPLISSEQYSDLLTFHGSKKAAATILTAKLSNPFGYGRILRNRRGDVSQIVEEKEATTQQKKIAEINTGTYCFDLARIQAALPTLTSKNTQNEFYLTDCIAGLVKQRKKVVSLIAEQVEEVLGINTLSELSHANRLLRDRILEKWSASGVLFVDPNSTYVDHDVVIGPQTRIYPFTFLENGTKIGSNCTIGPNSRLTASSIGNEVKVQYSVLLEAQVADGGSIGPFAYLRPGTRLEKGVKVGDFVEIKNSTIGPHSKVPHLSYVGDATIGAGVNIGAGTITCNYDGKGKYQTVIEDGAFIGSNTNLRAPVRIGKNAITGAGSVVTKDVEPGTTVAGVPAKVIHREESYGG